METYSRIGLLKGHATPFRLLKVPPLRNGSLDVACMLVSEKRILCSDETSGEVVLLSASESDKLGQSSSPIRL
jgi:hypothetical protein